jgi:pilus assembly protein Flp/PilA
VRLFKQLLRDDEATTAVEYAVMLAMIMLACIGTVATFGGQTGTLWGDTDTKLKASGFGAAS